MWYRRLAFALFSCLTIANAEASVIDTTPGLLYHLDSSSGVVTSGNAVTAWNDLSPNGNNFTQTSGPNQPTLITVPGQFNNLPVVHFNGSSDFLTLSNATTPQTVFIVGETATGVATLAGIWGSPADYGIRLDNTTLPFPFRAPPGNTNGGDFPTAFQLDGANTIQGGLNTPYVLSASSSLSPAQSFATTDLGGYFAGRSWDGNIAAVAVYDRVLTPTEQLAIIKSLGSEFGIATPEPGTLTLSLLGLAIAAAATRRRKVLTRSVTR